MFGSDFRSLFSEKPKKTWQSGLGPSGGSWRVQAGSLADDAADDDRFGAFQQAWKSGASNAELFGDDPFQLGGSVGAGNSAIRTQWGLGKIRSMWTRSPRPWMSKPKSNLKVIVRNM